MRTVKLGIQSALGGKEKVVREELEVEDDWVGKTTLQDFHIYRICH